MCAYYKTAIYDVIKTVLRLQRPSRAPSLRAALLLFPFCLLFSTLAATACRPLFQDVFNFSRHCNSTCFFYCSRKC